MFPELWPGSLASSPRDLPSLSTPSAGGVTSLHRHTQLFMWDLNSEAHSYAASALSRRVISPALEGLF